MFTLALRRLYFVSDRAIVRNLRNKRFPVVPNPGMQERIAAFKREGIKIQDDDAEEFVEQSESDFYKVGEADIDHRKASLKGKLELRHKIVKDKYFKENLPNLLTWSEKEQIRHLVQTQPDAWTLERIAESFPVTVPVVKKLIKYPWKPATKERIARHDESAMRNWKELKEGSLDIPEDLREHFLKFSERTIPPLDQKSLKIDLTPEDDKMGEFESIIRKCAAKAEQSKQQEQSEEQTTQDTDLTVIEYKPSKKDLKRVTLDALTDKIQKRLEKGKDIGMNDSIILTTVKSRNENSLQEQHPERLSSEIELPTENSKATQMARFKEDVAQASEVDFTKRIRIPKKAYKKGATYKVDDCYYDEDGRFLYRVLGMTN